MHPPGSTRSNKVLSPWQYQPVSPNFSFESSVKHLLDETHSPALESGEENFHDDSPALSPLTTPENTPPPSPQLQPASGTSDIPALPTLPPLPLAAPAQDTDPGPAVPRTDKDRRKAQRKANRTLSRNRKYEQAGLAFEKYQVRETIQNRYIQGTQEHTCPIEMEKIEVTMGGFEGLRDKGRSDKIYGLEELTGPASKFGFTLVEWDGIKPTLLLAQNRRVVGILAGNPGDEDWPDVARQAADALESRRSRCTFQPDPIPTRQRGDFTHVSCGISHGGGQRKPSNVRNTVANQRVLDELNSMRCFRRISGFSTSVLASRAPRLYLHYKTTLGALYKHDPSLARPFPFSVFPRTMYNLGPRTVCYKHTDRANLAYGVCSISSFGDYDPKKGGHIVLWEYQLVVQFPPGSTILIPSAVVSHSNTAISKSERRYSFTQYAAGALFRWVENKFQAAQRYCDSLTPAELKAEKEMDKRRWKEGVSLLPVVENVTCVDSN